MFFANLLRSKAKGSFLILSVILTLFLVGNSSKRVRAQSDSGKNVITVTMKNFKFIPNEINIPTGQKVTLEFHNKGSVVHAFMAGNDLTEELEGYKNGMFSGLTVTKKVNGKTMQKTYKSDESLMLGVKPGHTATLTFSMPESKQGEYEFGCFKTTGTAKTKHYKLGMKGSIKVGGSMAATNS